MDPQTSPLLGSDRSTASCNELESDRRTSQIRFGFDEFNTFSKNSNTIRKCIIAFISYFVIGVVLFSGFAKWTIIDSMYFTSVTVTTCGFGDLVPMDRMEMIYTGIFVVIGLLIIASIVFEILFENIFAGYNAIIDSARSKSSSSFLRRFHSNSQSLKNESRRTLWVDMLSAAISMLPLVLLLSFCALGIGHVEGWDWIQSFYFLLISSTTIGYGDVSPKLQSTRCFSILFLPFSVAVTAEFFRRISGVYLSHKSEQAEEEFLNRRLTETDIDRMDFDRNGSVNHEEFVRFMLIAMGKCSAHDLDRLDAVFKRLDKNGEGLLNKDDIVDLAMLPERTTEGRNIT
jgi:hypothetical protein